MKEFVPAIPFEKSLPPPKFYPLLENETGEEAFPLFVQLTLTGW